MSGPRSHAGKTVLPQKDTVRAETPKRDAILDAATRVFLAHGYEGASMDLVAKESGAARCTVYNQFESKEALFAAAVQRVWWDFPVVEITADRQALNDPTVGLGRLGKAIVDFWEPPIAVAFLRMVISEGTRFPDLPRNFFEAGKAPAMRALIGYLKQINENGTLAIPDAELAARQFLGLLNEPLLWLRVVGVGEAPSATERKRVVEEAVAMMMARYSPARN
ncbi:TetR/AcrR family transcriptional regulator [Pseudoxanthomonas sp. Root630]|uniref:TetR/AcrR family transcriptional regulator n=1 Tax=Pseudoxanthomonas sp. Root630 TaxID=1736574 RepID=UPI000A744BA7|nr:TetR/AcrR family transcriptional regulator [Pseudoxanthomonas sp. Root630]